MQCVAALCLPSVRWSLRDGEDTDESERKHLFIPFMNTVVVIFFAYLLSSLASGRMISVAWEVVVLCVSIGLLARAYGTQKLELVVVEGVMVFLSITICLIGDIIHHGQHDGWTSIVVAMDIFLLLNGRKGPTDLVRYVTVVFLVVRTVDEVSCYGLFTWIGGAPECTPAGWSVGLGLLMTRLAVFLIDFALTQRFAVGMREQRAKALRSLELAEKVANALVRFDLEEAEKLVPANSTEDLHTVFRSLLNNLHHYRPYLPDTLITSLTESIEVHDRIAPGSNTPNPEVTIVFTDIESSTSMWEASPSLMKRALDIHNNIIRTCIDQSNGYEVKTAGDAFMIAFDNEVDACEFCLAAQLALFEYSWPDDVRQMPPCATADGVWNGIRVRMGVHSGPVDVVQNPLTNRMDYIGRTVNKAARVESIAQGGHILISEEVMVKVKPHLQRLQDPFLSRPRPVELKGIPPPSSVATLLPKSLIRRKSVEPPTRPSVQVVRFSAPTTDNDVLRVSSSDIGEESVTRSSISHTSPDFFIKTYNQVRATIAYVNGGYSYLNFCADPLKEVGEMIAHVSDGLDRSGGSILSTYGGNVQCCWNIGKKTELHATQAARFVGLLHRSAEGSVGKEWAKFLSVGVMTGEAKYCNTGTATKKFVMALGMVTDLACCLSNAAHSIRVLALAAAAPGFKCAADDPSYKRHFRVVDTWFFKSTDPIDVFQINEREVCEAGLIIPRDAAEWGWSTLYEEAYRAGDCTAISLHSSNDCVLEQVASNLRSHPRKHLPTSPLLLWDDISSVFLD